MDGCACQISSRFFNSCPPEEPLQAPTLPYPPRPCRHCPIISRVLTRRRRTGEPAQPPSPRNMSAQSHDVQCPVVGPTNSGAARIVYTSVDGLWAVIHLLRRTKTVTTIVKTANHRSAISKLPLQVTRVANVALTTDSTSANDTGCPRVSSERHLVNTLFNVLHPYTKLPTNNPQPSIKPDLQLATAAQL